MKTLNESTRIIKPDIVVDNSSIATAIFGNSEMTYNFIIHFNFEQVPNRQNVLVWQYNYICINEPLSYSLILSRLICEKYNDNDALAIVLNYNNPYEDEEKKEEHRLEYEALQYWRFEAKRIAKEAYGFALEKQFKVI